MAAKREVRQVNRRRSAGDVLAGLGAVLVLAGLVAGVPTALLRFYGSPLPSEVPGSDLFTQQVGPSTLVYILVLLVWIAWLQLVVCVAVELYAGIRGIGVPAQVPLAGGTQSVVHRLVVAALLLFTATTAVMPAFGGRVDLQPARPTVSVAQAEFSAQPVAAEAPPAAPAETRVAPVTTAAPAEHHGETTKIYKVLPPEGRHHESLWEIAEKSLGDGRRYGEIYELNKGHVQPDGSHLHRAGLIRPGWVLEMPADATGAQVIPKSQLQDYFTYGHPVHHQAAPGEHHQATPPKHGDHTQPSAGAAHHPGQTAEPSGGGAAHPSAGTSQHPGRTAGPTQEPGAAAHPSAGTSQHPGQTTEPSAGATQQPPARPSQQPSAGATQQPPAQPSQQPSAQPSAGAAQQPSGHATPGRMSGGAAQQHAVPRPSGTVEGESAPSPAGGDATHVAGQGSARQDGHGFALTWQEELAGASLLAAGLLVALARKRRAQMWNRVAGRMIARPEGDAMEAEQALRVGADPEAVRLLDLGLRQLSKSLAAERRSLPTVYGVHLGHDSMDLWIAPADPNPPEPWEGHDGGQVWRLYTEDAAEFEETELRDVLAPYPGLISIGTNENGRILVDLEAAHGLIALGGPEELRRGVLAAAAVELATNAWSDHMRITLVGFGDELGLIAPDRIRTVGTLAEALPELEARAAEVRQALAASGVGDVLTGRCKGVFGEAWMPHYLIMADQPSSDEANRLVALARTGPRMAAGYLVAGDVPGAAWTWECGYGADDEDRLTAGVLGFDVEAQVVPDRHYRAIADLFRTAGRLEPGALLPDTPPDAEPYGAGAGEQSPAADVRILGGIEVEAPGPMEDGRRALCTEVLVFLATHPNGVHPTVLSGAVWPRGVAAGVRDATIARVSDWLGRDSRGRPNLYHDDAGRIRLGSEVRVDLAVFRWLVWRSAAEPDSEMAYLSYALDLVRAPLLADRQPGRYAWLAAEDLEYEAAARVVDVAHRLALLRLDENDPHGAADAARAGLRMIPDEQGLWRDLLRAVHATGDQAELRDTVEDLRTTLDRDPRHDQLHPETEALIEELLPFYRPPARMSPIIARGA